jgi:hypothetical protein
MEQKTIGRFRSLWARLSPTVTSALPRSRRMWLIAEFIIYASLTSLLVSRIPMISIPEYGVGGAARMDIVTPVELIVVDPERTERLRQEEAQKVAPVFRFDHSAVESAVGRLRSSFATTREQFLDAMDTTLRRRQMVAEEIGTLRFDRFVASFQETSDAFHVSRERAAT